MPRPIPNRLFVACALLAFAGGALLMSTPDPKPIAKTLPSWIKPGPDGNEPGGEEFQTVDLEQRRKPGPSGAMKALQMWSAGRAYPGETLAKATFATAIDQVRGIRARKSSTADSRVSPWQALGPHNVGGRTLSLAIHPNDPETIFAGSASGGLWKTTVGGVGASAWTYVDTGSPVLGVSTIAIDTSNPDVMYIGTGEGYDYQSSHGGDTIRTTRGSYGVGILKTVDGGLNWTKSLDWTYDQSRSIWMVRIHPTDSNIVYAATTQGVYKSMNAGASWDLVHSVIMAMDVRIHPTIPDTVFAAHGNFGSVGHGIYRSTDAGQSWDQLRVGLPFTWTGKAQLAISPATPDTIFASIADAGVGHGLHKSANRGDSWTRVNNTDYQRYQGWYSHYVVASPFDDQTLFVAGIEIWRSTNGGNGMTERSNWQDVYYGTSPPEGPIGDPGYAHADHHFAVWHPSDPNTIFFASDGGVFKTTDLGVTFESLIGGYQTTQFYNGFSNSATDRDFAMGGLQDNFTVVYQGDGAWARVIGGDGSWTAQNQALGSTIYGSAQGLYLVRSYDSGANWTEIHPPDQAADLTAFIAPYVLCPDEPTVLYAGRAHVYRSDDEGNNWSATNGGLPLSPGNPVIQLAAAKTTADVAFAGTAPIASRAQIFTTRDGGATWLDVTGSLPDRFPSDLTVDPTDPQTAYVTFLGFGTSHVFKTTDGGNNWIDISNGLPDIPTSAVEVDPDFPNIIYVGTDLGIYISADGGLTWGPFINGMPLTMVNDLKVFRPDRLLRAATHGNGAYERELFTPSILRNDVPVNLPAVADALLPWTDPDPVLTGPFPRLLYYQVEGFDRIFMVEAGASITILE